jgi:serine/threonine protein kinase
MPIEAPRLPGMSFVKQLGQGGFAEVFLYEQQRPRMRVAVKVMLGEGISDAARERFAAEANAMAELADHPNIVQVFRSDVTEDGRPYMVMKYYPQRNLAVRARAERIPVPEVLQIGVRIASAVETAHRAGILHRDIKPANILTSQYGEPGLTDFGIATTVGAEASSESDGMSIPWSPPEVLYGKSPGDRLSDVYSLGATLWQLLVGRSPFEEPDGDNTTVALMRRIKEDPPHRTGRPDVPPSLERILAQAMAKNSADRPASALQLVRNLQAVETEQGWTPTPLVVLVGDPAEPESDDQEQGAEPATRSGSGRSQTTPTSRAPETVRRPARPEPKTKAKSPQKGLVQPSIRAVPLDDRDPSDGTRRRPALLTAVDPQSPRARQGMPAEVKESATVRRPSAPAPEAGSVPEPPPAEHGRGRQAWAIGGVGVAAIAAVLGVALSLGSHGHSPVTPTTLPGPTSSVFQQATNQPTVLAKSLSPTDVEFYWNDPGAQPGDTFLYQENALPWKSTGKEQHVDLPVAVNGSVCVAVKIDRSGPIGAASNLTCNKD